MTQISKICKVSISLWFHEWPKLSCLGGEQWLIIWSKVIFKSCWLNELKRNPTPNWTDFSRFGELIIYICILYTYIEYMYIMHIITRSFHLMNLVNVFFLLRVTLLSPSTLQQHFPLGGVQYIHPVSPWFTMTLLRVAKANPQVT